MDEMSPARQQRRYEAFECVKGAGLEGASVQDVSKCLGLAVGPHLRSLLDELVKDGYLQKKESLFKTGKKGNTLRNGFKYFIIPASES